MFSQADRYGSIIEMKSNLRNVYREYLPFIASAYPHIQLFAISSVSKTVPGNVPVPDSYPEGIEKLTAWVALQQRETLMYGWYSILYFIPFINIVYTIYVYLLILTAKIRFGATKGWQIKR